MKVCMISTNHNIYDDRIYWKEALSLKNNGYEVFSISISNKEESGVSTEGIKYYTIRPRARHYKSIFKRNIFFDKTFSTETYEYIFELAKGLKCDIYHFHDLYLNIIGPKLKKLPFKPKVIYDVHEFYPDYIRDYYETKGIKTLNKYIYSWYIDIWEKVNSSYYDFIITADGFTCDYFKKKLNKNNVDIIYNFTDFKLKNNLKNKKDRYYDAVYCGGITKVRGIFKILESIKIGKEYCPNIKLLILGPCDQCLRQEIDQYIKENNINNNVDFKGVVSYKDVPQYLENSKIGLVTLLPISKFKKNIPIKQFEYMALGLPIIGSDLEPIKQFVEKYNSGIIVNSLNPNEIWEAICKLLNDDELYNMYSKNAFNSVRMDFNWINMENRLLNIYRKICHH